MAISEPPCKKTAVPARLTVESKNGYVKSGDPTFNVFLRHDGGCMTVVCSQSTSWEQLHYQAEVLLEAVGALGFPQISHYDGSVPLSGPIGDSGIRENASLSVTSGARHATWRACCFSDEMVYVSTSAPVTYGTLLRDLSLKVAMPVEKVALVASNGHPIDRDRTPSDLLALERALWLIVADQSDSSSPVFQMGKPPRGPATPQTFREKEVYHERQNGSQCARHSLNVLFQGNVFSTQELIAIAGDLDRQEAQLLQGSQIDQLGNMVNRGNFNIQVLIQAAAGKGVDLCRLGSSDASLPASPTKRYDGVIAHKRSHWFTFAEVNRQWYELDSHLSSPRITDSAQMDAMIHQMNREGVTMFVRPRKELPSTHECEGPSTSAKAAPPQGLPVSQPGKAAQSTAPPCGAGQGDCEERYKAEAFHPALRKLVGDEEYERLIHLSKLDAEFAMLKAKEAGPAHLQAAILPTGDTGPFGKGICPPLSPRKAQAASTPADKLKELDEFAVSPTQPVVRRVVMRFMQEYHAVDVSPEDLGGKLYLEAFQRWSLGSRAWTLHDSSSGEEIDRWEPVHPQQSEVRLILVPQALDAVAPPVMIPIQLDGVKKTTIVIRPDTTLVQLRYAAENLFAGYPIASVGWGARGGIPLNSDRAVHILFANHEDNDVILVRVGLEGGAEAAGKADKGQPASKPERLDPDLFDLLAETLAHEGPAPIADARKRCAGAVKKLGAERLTKALAGMGKDDKDKTWKSILRASNNEFQWLTDEQKLAKKTGDKQKPKKQDTATAVRKKDKMLRSAPKIDPASIQLIHCTFRDEGNKPLPVLSGTDFSSEGVALVADEDVARRLITNSRTSPKPGAIGLVMLQDIPDLPGKPVDITVTGPRDQLIGLTVYVWQLGVAKVSKDESKAVRFTGPALLTFVFQAASWHVNQSPIPWMAGRAPMSKRHLPKAKARPNASIPMLAPGEALCPDPLNTFKSLWDQILAFPLDTFNAVFLNRVDTLDSVEEDTRSRTAEGKERHVVKYLVKLTEDHAHSWLRESGDVFFCEPIGGMDSVPYSAISVGGTAKANWSTGRMHLRDDFLGIYPRDGFFQARCVNSAADRMCEVFADNIHGDVQNCQYPHKWKIIGAPRIASKKSLAHALETRDPQIRDFTINPRSVKGQGELRNFTIWFKVPPTATLIIPVEGGTDMVLRPALEKVRRSSGDGPTVITRAPPLSSSPSGDVHMQTAPVTTTWADIVSRSSEEVHRRAEQKVLATLESVLASKEGIANAIQEQGISLLASRFDAFETRHSNRLKAQDSRIQEMHSSLQVINLGVRKWVRLSRK